MNTLFRTVVTALETASTTPANWATVTATDARFVETKKLKHNMEPTPTVPPSPGNKLIRKKSVRKPSAPRKIDPEISALRAKHKADVAALRKGRASAKMLAKLLAKIAKLTPEDKDRLREAIGAPVAPE